MRKTGRSMSTTAGSNGQSLNSAWAALKGRFAGLPSYTSYVGGGVVLLGCLITCLAIWGPGMSFPAEWGKPIGTKIDEWVLWLTRRSVLALQWHQDDHNQGSHCYRGCPALVSMADGHPRRSPNRMETGRPRHVVIFSCRPPPHRPYGQTARRARTLSGKDQWRP